MSYQTFLASRGYRRVTVERTNKSAGDIVLHRVDQPVERVAAKASIFAPANAKVLQIRGRG